MAPVSLSSARMVFGDNESDAYSASGNRVIVPTAGDGFVRLVELRFTAGQGAGLFGNKDELLQEWRRKLPDMDPVPTLRSELPSSVDHRALFAQAIPAFPR